MTADSKTRFHRLAAVRGTVLAKVGGEMGNTPWQCAEKFREVSDEFHKVGPKLSLLFQGSTEAIERIHDVTKPPPASVQNHPFTNGEFVCWLQLPLDLSGSEWSFGRVVWLEGSEEQLDKFRIAAAEAGSCLRKNLRFREWLMGCLSYITQADRLPQLLEGEDIAWWLALLFMKPDVLKPQAKHGAAFVKIDDAVSLSQRAIRSRGLATNQPLWPVATQVIRPFARMMNPSDFSEGKTSSKPQKSAAELVANDSSKPEGMPDGELRNLMEKIILAMGENGFTTSTLKKSGQRIASWMKPRQNYNSQLRAVLRQLRLPPYELLSPPSGHGYFLNSKGVAVYEQLKKDRREKSPRKMKSH